MTGWKRLIPLCVLALVGTACAPGIPAPQTSTPPASTPQIVTPQTPVTGVSFAMNTVIEYSLYGEQAQIAKQAMDAALLDLERQVSMYIEDSEISRLNQNAGGDFISLSPDAFALLARSVGYGNLSSGVFDVTIAPLTAAWNITGEDPKIPPPQQIQTLLELVDYRDIQLSGDQTGEKFSARLARPGQQVDLGGIAKGYACGLLRRTALENGVTSGFVSIGGNLMVIGEKPNGTPFRFGVRDPRGTDNEYIGVVTLPNSTMATSGDYERYFEQDGVRYHHVLDPATGMPAQTDLMSVSVISPDGAYADFMSTYLLIKGKAFALEQLDAGDCQLIVIDKEKNVYVSQSLKESFTPAETADGYRWFI